MQEFIISCNIDTELPSGAFDRLLIVPSSSSLPPSHTAQVNTVQTLSTHCNSILSPLFTSASLHKNVLYRPQRTCLPAASTLYVTVEQSTKIDIEDIQLLLQPHLVTNSTETTNHLTEEKLEVHQNNNSSSINIDTCILHHYLNDVLTCSREHVESNNACAEEELEFLEENHKTCEKESCKSNYKVYIICAPNVAHLDDQVDGNAPHATSSTHRWRSRNKQVAQLYAETITWAMQKHVALGMCIIVDSVNDVVEHVASFIHHLAKELSAMTKSITSNSFPVSSNHSSEVKEVSNCNSIKSPNTNYNTHQSVELEEFIKAMKYVRPECGRKCEPTDFHHLYKNMLTEVNTFASRKVMATMAKFPTMHALLEHIDSNTTVNQALGQSQNEQVDKTCSVYNINYGEQRGYNIVNDDIVKALSYNYYRHTS